MNDKKLAILGILAVMMAGAAILQNRISKQISTGDFSSTALIEGLEIDVVDAIHISSESGGKTVKLARRNGRFTLQGKDSYPADVTKINALINSCLDIRTSEKITSSPSNHADLKVTDETAAYIISFLASEDKPIVTLLISETNAETNSAYGRLSSSDDVYLIERPPYIQAGAMDYIDALLVEVPSDQVRSVAASAPEGSYVLSSPEGSSEVALESMPEGKQYKGTDYQTVFNAINSVRCDDVMAAEKAPADMKFDYIYTSKNYDLTVYKFALGKQDEKVYAKVTADYLDKTPVEKTVGQVETDEELKKKEAKLLAIDKVKAFNEKHKNWVYQIPSYKADNLTKPLSELIEDVPAEEEKAEEENAESEPAKTES
ncbi:MAG: DUF4340 domain-containing protein [Planctomycetota bacterium]|jgi:hypothetical protein